MLSTRYLYAVLLCALTPSGGGTYPSYTAPKHIEGAVPSGGVPHVYREGGPPLHIHNRMPTDTAEQTAQTAPTAEPHETQRTQGTTTSMAPPSILLLMTESMAICSVTDVDIWYVEGDPPSIYMGAPSLYTWGRGGSPYMLRCSIGGGTYPHSRG